MIYRSRFIGVDPGPIPGIVELRCLDGRLIETGVLQTTSNLAPSVFTALLAELSAEAWRTPVQVEKFVVGRRASRSSTASAGEVTRDLVGALQREARVAGVDLVLRTASQVKIWATDERLDAIGLLEATKGMRHARDGGRHALFAAVHAGDLHDPLSRLAGSRGGRR